MSIIDSLSVSVSGMTAQRQRVNTISENLANANTTRTPQGGPYRRREVIFAAVANDRKFEDELRAQERSLDTATQVKVVGPTKRMWPLSMPPRACGSQRWIWDEVWVNLVVLE